MKKTIKNILTIVSVSWPLMVISAVPGYYGIDGDTLRVPMTVLPKDLPLSVRVLGIDTPEKGWRAKCELEKELGEQATAYTKERLRDAETVKLENIKWDKYGGRINADVYIDGSNLKDELIKLGFAREYDGTGSKPDWCDESLLRVK